MAEQPRAPGDEGVRGSPHELPATGHRDPPDGAAGGPQPVGGDLVIPVAGLAFTAYYFATIWDLTWEAQVNGLVIGSTLIVLIAVYLVRVGLAVARGQATLGLGALAHPRGVQGRRAALLVLAVAFIWLLEWIGFTLAVAAFMGCALWVLGVRDARRLVGLPVLLSLGGYLLFIVALETRFPHGPVERLLGRLF